MTAMDSIADVAAPEAALAIPRFEDGFVNMQELLRQLAESVVNEIMSAEADQLCGATGNSRNGYRERRLVTCVGTLTLRIPKLRAGSFFPDDVIERYQKADRAIVAAVSEMYADALHTRTALCQMRGASSRTSLSVGLSSRAIRRRRGPSAWFGVFPRRRARSSQRQFLAGARTKPRRLDAKRSRDILTCLMMRTRSSITARKTTSTLQSPISSTPSFTST